MKGSSYCSGKMTRATRMTSKGQVVIPKEARDRLRWRAGARLDVEVGSGVVVLRAARAKQDPIDRAFGFLDRGDPLAALEIEHRDEIAGDERRRRRGRMGAPRPAPR